jgi:hypothetical protein
MPPAFFSSVTLISLLSLLGFTRSQYTQEITLVEGEIYFISFLDLVLTNKESNLEFSPSVPDILDYTDYRPLRYRQIIKSSLMSESPTKDKFLSAQCFLDIKGLKDVISIVYSKQLNASTVSNTTGHSKYFLQQKETFYKRSLDKPLQSITQILELDAFDMGSIPINSEFCIEPILVIEHKRILMVCSAAFNNQFFVVNICSDKSCSERSEPLKIKDFIKDVTFSFIRTKLMPGINDQTYALLVWFEGYPFIESILFDTSGNLASDVYRMDYPIWTIRYFSGQLLIFDTYFNSEHIYLYTMFEFGFKRLDMGSMEVKQTKGFGTFINSYVNSVNGLVEIELLEDKMLVQLGLQRSTKNFLIETSQSLFDVQEQAPKAEQLLIFEMNGDYQLMTIAPNSTSSYGVNKLAFSNFRIIHRVDNFKELRNDFPFAKTTTMWRKVSGFNQMRGCSIEGNSTHGFNMTIVQIEFHEPVIYFNSSRIVEKSVSKQRTSRVLESSDTLFEPLFAVGHCATETNNRVLQSPSPSGIVNQEINITRKAVSGTAVETIRTYKLKVIRATEFNLFLKWAMTSTSNIIDVELMGISSDQYLPIERAIKGNFIGVHSFETSLKRTVVIGDRINPLLNYKTIWYARGQSQLAEDIDLADGFFSIMSTYNYKSSFQFITYRASDQQVAIYKTQGKDLVLQRIESTKFKANYFELYNSTVAIIQGDQGLYIFDSVKSTLKELLIDAGRCEHILVGKHSLLDSVVWCFSNTGISAYYARDLVGGQAGIRKLTVVLDVSVPIDFKTIIIRTSEYFPDIIFMMITDTSHLICFKVDTKSSLLLTEVSREKIGLPLAEIKTLDFNLIDQYLIVYQVQRIGYGSKILFEFYYIQTPMIMIKTKSMSLDYNFSPDFSTPRLLPLVAKKLDQTSRQKYSSTPYFLLKVKVDSEYENILYINPLAPLTETIPHTVLRLRSKVNKIKMGECLMIDDSEIKLSAVIFYSFSENNIQRHSLIKLDESSPQIFLGTDFDNSAEYTRSFVDPESMSITLLNFDSEPNSIKDVFLTVKMNYIRKHNSARSNQVSKLGQVQFSDDVRVVEMENLPQLPTAEDARTVDRTLYYLIDLENLIAGDIESWSITAESQLEQTSGVINLKSLIRNITEVPAKRSPSSFTAVIGTSMTNSSCTKVQRTTRKVDFFGKETTVPCDFSVCLGEAEIAFKLDLYYGSVVYSLNSTKPNNLMITDPSLIGQLFEGDIMLLVVRTHPNGRNIYVDFYSIEISHRTVPTASFQAGWLARRFFSEATKDFLIRMRPNRSDFNPSFYYEYFEFSVQKAVTNAYNVTISWELWNLKNHANRSFYLDGKPRKVLQASIPQTLYNGASTMEIHEDVVVRLLNHNDDYYIWMAFETIKYDSYIVRYARPKIFSEPIGDIPYRSSVLPDVWRLSNPYYGYDSLYSIKTRKVDWLFVQAKALTELKTRVLIYYTPPSIFVQYPTQIESIYAKQSMNISSIVDIRSENIFGYNEPELADRKSETYKRVLFIRSDGSYISTDIYPRLEFHFSNIYIASSYIELSAKGVRGRSTKKRIEIKASRHDNFFGKSQLHGYLILLLIISITIVVVIYQSIRSQTSSAKSNKLSKIIELSKKTSDDRTKLLDGQPKPE